MLESALSRVARVYVPLWVPRGTPGDSGLLEFAVSWIARVRVSHYVPVLGCGLPVCHDHAGHDRSMGNKQSDGGPHGLGLLITLGPFGRRNPTRCGGKGVVMRRWHALQWHFFLPDFSLLPFVLSRSNILACMIATQQ